MFEPCSKRFSSILQANQMESKKHLNIAWETIRNIKFCLKKNRAWETTNYITFQTQIYYGLYKADERLTL